MVVYLVLESRFANGCMVVKAFSTKQKATKFVTMKAKRQKNKPQYDDWGLVEGVEYLVAKIKVN